ncbi:hypothetical protein Back11_29280 [Paenibacillus baekrokdamisoli]|uniref:Uncharacterized protein n=1 Tax=Paenibacillus baekrokdamisoli TaxID=1712516 RepID=A0A3G9J9M4_9BACL|nr:hypothetical protein [Paenibacillus baekrokdamisoli]MBB3071164.1 hypothetical protein [Paenibacillus baekrokdamisoli]BBH21583.1 hypothetical protein Back11_29280 [Paenibacillus baekrokdamisoli]
MISKHYKVLWSSYARVALAHMQPFKVDAMSIFRRSKSVLSSAPHEKAYGISDFPGFAFNGYSWTLIGNTIVIYKVDHALREVYVDACYFANTGTAHHIFWGIDPDEE